MNDQEYPEKSPEERKTETFSAGSEAQAGNGKKEDSANGKTKLGLDEKVEVGLTYLLGWLSGAVFYFVEKENKKIQYHAAQSVIVFLGLMIVAGVIGIIPVIGGILALLISLLLPIAWIFLMVQGFTGKDFRCPVISGFIEDKLVGKVDEITSSTDNN